MINTYSISAKSRWVTRMATVVGVLSVLAPVTVRAEEKVLPGAVLSVRGPARAMAAMESELSGVRPLNISVEALHAGALFIKQRGRSQDEAEPYSRKTNFCKRAMVRRMLRDLGHIRCEPNSVVSASAVTPNDRGFPWQTDKTFLGLPAAWERTTGSDELLVMVTDTGIDYKHPDLVDNIWTNPGEIPENGIDDDGNGVIDDIHGYNAFDNDRAGDPMDDNGHGTQAAGIIGGRGNNSIGVAGVAWRVKIIGAKAFDQDGNGGLVEVIKATNYGTKLRKAGHKLVVSNNSWGGDRFNQSLKDSIQRAGDAGIPTEMTFVLSR